MIRELHCTSNVLKCAFFKPGSRIFPSQMNANVNSNLQLHEANVNCIVLRGMLYLRLLGEATTACEHSIF